MKKGLVVFVPGIPGFGEVDKYWESGSESSILPDNLNVINVFPSPVGSHHDRACEIFAQLSGAIVDYGESHAKIYGHARYGRNYEKNPPLHPSWSNKYPIHVICHSSAINTARMLQKLLNDDFWNKSTKHDWVLSITSINSCFNYCAISELLNKEILNSMSKKEPCTKCSFIPEKTICVHKIMKKAAKIMIRTVLWVICNKLKLNSDELAKALDWPMEHWSYNKNGLSTIKCDAKTEDQIIENLKSYESSPLFQIEDNIIFEHLKEGFIHLDKSINDIISLNCDEKVHPKFIYPQTYYLALFSKASDFSNCSIPSEMSPILWPFGSILLEYDNSKNLNGNESEILKKIRTLSGSDNPLNDNDGFITIYDQCVPNYAESNIDLLPQFPDTISAGSCETVFKSGVWYIDSLQKWVTNFLSTVNKDVELCRYSNAIHRINTWDHFDICWLRTTLKCEKDIMPLEFQRKFYQKLFFYISRIETQFSEKY